MVGGGGGGGGGGRGGGAHSVFFLKQFLVIKLFIRWAGNEDGHKTLDEFEFVQWICTKIVQFISLGVV